MRASWIPASGFLGDGCSKAARAFVTSKENVSLSHSSMDFNFWNLTRVWWIPGWFGGGGSVGGVTAQITTATSGRKLTNPLSSQAHRSRCPSPLLPPRLTPSHLPPQINLRCIDPWLIVTNWRKLTSSLKAAESCPKSPQPRILRPGWDDRVSAVYKSSWLVSGSWGEGWGAVHCGMPGGLTTHYSQKIWCPHITLNLFTKNYFKIIPDYPGISLKQLRRFKTF